MAVEEFEIYSKIARSDFDLGPMNSSLDTKEEDSKMLGEKRCQGPIVDSTTKETTDDKGILCLPKIHKC